MKFTVHFLGLLLITLQAKSQDNSNGKFEKEIFKTEKAFSDYSKKHGFIAATIKYADDSALVFRPALINSKQWSTRLIGTDSNYQITWYCSDVKASSAGDLGYATGPFDNVSKIPGDDQQNHGQFLTIWKRQTDGTFKYVIDFGSNQLPVEEFVKKEPIFKTFAKKSKYKSAAGKVSIQDLLRLEYEFIKEDSLNGDASSYKKFADSGILFFYQRQFYVKGFENVFSRINPAGKHSWQPINGDISQSGDLGYVYGKHVYTDLKGETRGCYIRIWQYINGAWKIVAQVRNLLPKLTN